MESCDQFDTRINEYFKNRMKTDVNFPLIRNRIRRIHHALNSKTKSSSAKEVLCIDIETNENWIKFQMTPEMTWLIIEIDHVKPICMFDFSKDDELQN